MDVMSLLAVVTEEAAPAAQPVLDVAAAKTFLWNQISGMHWLYALMMLSVGIVYLLYGWRIFRVLVVISFGFIGLFLGMLSGDKFFVSDHAILWGGIIGMGLLAAMAVPLMKWCVSMLGAMAGGILTSGIWIAFGLSETYLPAGFIVGFIAGGLISFIMLKISVMLFTSLGGALILISGLLALIHAYDLNVSNPVTSFAYDLIYTYQWFLPVALITVTSIGIALQNKFIKQSPKWEI
jgi:hypothetical protein